MMHLRSLLVKLYIYDQALIRYVCCNLRLEIAYVINFRTLRVFLYLCCVVVTMEVEVTSLQGMMGILRNSCIRKKDGGEVSYSGCDAKNRNDSY